MFTNFAKYTEEDSGSVHALIYCNQHHRLVYHLDYENFIFTTAKHYIGLLEFKEDGGVMIVTFPTFHHVFNTNISL